MISLTKGELFELAAAYIVTNTPSSLFESLRETSAVTKMRYEVPLSTLMDYYDRVTSRGKRSEISMALAYGALEAILLHKDNLGTSQAPDVTRLKWGEQLKTIAASGNTPTRVINLPAQNLAITNTPSPQLVIPSRVGQPWRNSWKTR
jgi:hypothetical protein